MIFTLAEIALSMTWHTSTYVLTKIYNGLYYLYYGSVPSAEDIKSMEVEEIKLRIALLEKQLDEKNSVELKSESND